MSAWLIILTGAIYAYIAGEQLYKENPHMAIVYAGYAFSNVGLYLLAKSLIGYKGSWVSKAKGGISSSSSSISSGATAS